MNSFLINPFEQIGKLHNEGLDYVAKKLTPASIPKIDDIIQLSAEFACRQWRSDNSFSSGELASMYSVVSFAIIHLNDIKPLYQEVNLNQPQIVF